VCRTVQLVNLVFSEACYKITVGEHWEGDVIGEEFMTFISRDGLNQPVLMNGVRVKNVWYQNFRDRQTARVMLTFYKRSGIHV